MNRIIALFITLIVIIFFITVGALGLFIYQEYTKPVQPVATPQINQLSQADQQELNKLKSLKSSVISSFLLFGQVKNISGNTIILSYGRDLTSLTLDPSAKIYFVSTAKATTGKETPAQLSDIKIGENIQAQAQLSADDQLVGYSVLIVQ